MKTSTRSGEGIRLGLLSSILTDRPNSKVILGVSGMDDAAVVRCPPGEHLVTASDFVRGTEFYLHALGYLSHADLGYYLIAANISDIAAMGCTPAGLLTVIRYSSAMTDEQFADIFVGMNLASEKFDCPIVGGDIGGYKEDVFSASAFGFTSNQRYLTRKGATLGDDVFVSGTVGGAIAALTYCKEIKPKNAWLTPQEEEALLTRWRRPEPRVALGRLLCDNEYATSCMDVSDGLKASLLTLATASNVGIEIQEDAIPLHPSLIELSRRASLDSVALGMSASVDFELLFTVPSHRSAELEAICSENGQSVAKIGTVASSGSAVCTFLGQDGRQTEAPGITWDHQTSDHVKDILQLSSAKRTSLKRQ